MCRTFNVTIWYGLLNIWTRYVAVPPFQLSAQAIVGSRWSRDLRSRFPEVSARTQEYMQYMGGAPGIVHTFVFPSKH